MKPTRIGESPRTEPTVPSPLGDTWDEFPPGGCHSSTRQEGPRLFGATVAEVAAWLRAEITRYPAPEPPIFLCSPAHAAELRRALSEAWDRRGSADRACALS